jgi:hypothetical protein
MQFISLVFCVSRAVGRFDFRRAIDETLNEVAPGVKKFMQ